jgi:hypothetical protein
VEGDGVVGTDNRSAVGAAGPASFPINQNVTHPSRRPTNRVQSHLTKAWVWDCESFACGIGVGEETKSRNAMGYIDLSMILYTPFILVILGVFGASFAVRYL